MTQRKPHLLSLRRDTAKQINEYLTEKERDVRSNSTLVVFLEEVQETSQVWREEENIDNALQTLDTEVEDLRTMSTWTNKWRSYQQTGLSMRAENISVSEGQKEVINRLS